MDNAEKEALIRAAWHQRFEVSAPYDEWRAELLYVAGLYAPVPSASAKDHAAELTRLGVERDHIVRQLATLRDRERAAGL